MLNVVCLIMNHDEKCIFHVFNQLIMCYMCYMRNAVMLGPLDSFKNNIYLKYGDSGLYHQIIFILYEHGLITNYKLST